ncbi:MULTISPECIES: LON peptidase substrate-binding domain-containing protein [unclassified Vibrio]|uniref:LON peptidase substrate-binding domain-containing protein n=1 Tax=Vibrio sp. HB236076 TaxID=3232307 RepID=A0AB39HHZ3_9VIBR|nr:LON peptidase substrate-binding domain-containing protein [Vibrio sp. HB161653]MDP5254895.1 LON peptidase substrate-binding domain-containing protein [Vibrio sp. HB161653]
MESLSLFPLSSIVLPGGQMRLRIFEPRYQRLVKQCLRHNQPFVMCLAPTSNQVWHQEPLEWVGSVVSIVDFEQLEDGLLGITVQGLERCVIHSVETEYDGLRLCNIEKIGRWPSQPLSKADAILAHSLGEVYQQFPQLEQLNRPAHFDDSAWVSQRWLELLPLNQVPLKQLVLAQTCQQTLTFLHQTLLSDDGAASQQNYHH